MKSVLVLNISGEQGTGSSTFIIAPSPKGMQSSPDIRREKMIDNKMIKQKLKIQRFNTKFQSWKIRKLVFVASNERCLIFRLSHYKTLSVTIIVNGHHYDHIFVSVDRKCC